MLNKRGKLDAWSALILIGAVLIIVWALLKVAGIIKSPIWVEMIPYFGVGASMVGGAYKLGKIMKGIEDTNQKVDNLVGLETRFNKIEHEHGLAMSGQLKCPVSKKSK